MIGASGDVLTDWDVECDSDTVYVSYPILATAEIDLDVKLTPGGGVSAADVEYTLSTERITVAGTKEAVAEISGETLIIATIDLATVQDGDELTFSIPLTDELLNITGTTDVTVKISLSDDLETRTVAATNIDYINPPDGWEVQIVTQMLAVRVRGSSELLADVTEESIRVVVDLSGVSLTAGQHMVQAKIYLDSVGSVNEIGVLGNDYKVVIYLSPIEN